MATDDTRPGGGESDRPMWSMLEDELRRAVEADGELVEAGRLIVRRLVAKAHKGDMAAIKEIFDRMDGKPVPAAAPDKGPRKLIFAWRDYQYPWTAELDPAVEARGDDGATNNSGIV
jgi:hypothetical protein